MNNGIFKIISYLILLIYTLFTFGNLYMILQKKNTERNFFNVLLMPLLALFYFFRFKNHDILIYLAILFFWFGDILFTRRNKKNIIMGLPLFNKTRKFHKNNEFKLFTYNITNGIVFRICSFWNYCFIWICEWIL